MEAETKTCCVTGHRDIPAEKRDWWKRHCGGRWQRRLRMDTLDLFPVLRKVPTSCLQQSLQKRKRE